MHQPRHEKEKYIRCSWKGPVAQGEGKLKVSILSVFQLQFYFWSLTVQTVEVLGSKTLTGVRKKESLMVKMYIFELCGFSCGVYMTFI